MPPPENTTQSSSMTKKNQSSSWFFGRRSNDGETNEDVVHKKRLAMILRYIATMHHSAADHDASGFVRSVEEREGKKSWMSSYFSHEDEDDDDSSRVLFSMLDFARLVHGDGVSALFSSPPFSFYAADSAGSSKRKQRTLAGALKDSITILSSSSSLQKDDDRTCWLRLTRVAKEAPPAVSSFAVKEYLTNWKKRSRASSFKSLLTLDNLQRAPKVAPENNRQEIKSFLRKYKKYLIRKQIRSSLEPMYNQLFEWLQQHGGSSGGGGHEELVWGFGNAKWLFQNTDSSTTVVNGPLLEVLVEVELARDGALLVRPRQHTGVALNRQVVSAILSDGASSRDLLSTLYKTVAEMETSQLSPGQPSTYTPLLKRMAVQLSPDGTFLSSKEVKGKVANNAQAIMEGLVVTDAWCLFCRSKPSTVWARDASDLADQLLLQNEAATATLEEEQDTLPRATWALTHGPRALDDSSSGYASTSFEETGMLHSIKTAILGDGDKATPTKPLFALPTSDSQDLIADLLLSRHVPAVVCEGPPGTGKTHTIANIVCAYLCRGKRVCVTSKGAPALSVLRQRLPATVQELCVDVSMSESMGMQQLQQTVERLADRVSCVNTEVQTEKCRLLKQNIDELEDELRDIDEQLESHSEAKRRLLTSPEGQELAEASISLISTAPWFMKTITKWTFADTKAFYDRVSALVTRQEKDPIDLVTAYESPPADSLISEVAANAGAALSVVKTAAIKTVASVPGLGTVSGLSQQQQQLQDALDLMRVDGSQPQTKEDWQLALCALSFEKDIHTFHNETLDYLVTREGWAEEEIYVANHPGKRIAKPFADLVSKAMRLKGLARRLNVEKEMQQAVECAQLDSRRAKITSRIQVLAENMVEATVVAELRRTFSVEAQSALIKFAQVAGKSKFSKASQPSKMTQRQRRHRQEYVEAFERCVRYVPCWVLTSSQISDYLPSESGLFDLVVIDEASQSDITVLPGMLRGKQWLIVGDGKQVSPTESFISETQIDSLKASLPESPLADSLLPGQSFFDLCAQAFPRGRVVLSEHFRCAPEIVNFSNSQFYDGRLIPLRLPTLSERMTPSIVDVRVQGRKVGKVNERECDTIVSMIQELVDDPGPYPRSIGVISLIGDEQSRLIRGRVLDAIGPAKYKEHNILIGDPPTFQGAERDVIFLSLVCSVGSVPTQNQQMHAQRANVALSRARDRIVLVRSIDSSHIPNGEDVKGPIIEFFEASGADEVEQPLEENSEQAQTCHPNNTTMFSFRDQAEAILEHMLTEGGFSIRRMGVVWNDALCVENEDSSFRAAVCIDCAGESREEWKRVMAQQKSIERVGWHCLRVDALSVFMNFHGAFESVKEFLLAAGVEPSVQVPDEEVVLNEEINEQDGEQAVVPPDPDVDIDDQIEEIDAPNRSSPSIVVISSDEDAESDSSRMDGQSDAEETQVKVEPEGFDPEQFGDVVDLGFLRNQRDPERTLSIEDETDDTDSRDSDEPVARRRKRKSRHSENDDAYLGGTDSDDSSDSSSGRRGKRRRRRRYRRLDKYARDGRWYPGRNGGNEDEPIDTWYDTDSDLTPDPDASNEDGAASSRKNKKKNRA